MRVPRPGPGPNSIRDRDWNSNQKSEEENFFADIIIQIQNYLKYNKMVGTNLLLAVNTPCTVVKTLSVHMYFLCSIFLTQFLIKASHF